MLSSQILMVMVNVFSKTFLHNNSPIIPSLTQPSYISHTLPIIGLDITILTILGPSLYTCSLPCPQLPPLPVLYILWFQSLQVMTYNISFISHFPWLSSSNFQAGFNYVLFCLVHIASSITHYTIF